MAVGMAVRMAVAVAVPTAAGTAIAMPAGTAIGTEETELGVQKIDHVLGNSRPSPKVIDFLVGMKASQSWSETGQIILTSQPPCNHS